MTVIASPLLSGLSSKEAQERLLTYGANELSKPRKRTLQGILVHTLKEPMFLLLLLAAAIYLVIGDLGEGLFLCAGATLSIGLVIFQEMRSENALAALRSLAAPQARVIRDRTEQTIPASELVPGDIILVGEGNRAPADATLRGGDVLTIDESILTGESAPVLRTPAVVGANKESALYAGTLIVRGHAWAEVTATGERTQFGSIGKSLLEGREEATALQRSSQRLVMLLAALGIACSVAIFIAYGVMRQDWLGGALTGVTLAIALLPEEFPMVLAIFMALGSWRLARHNVLVRRSAVVEALGGASLLCVDKTGTLTRNRMQLSAIWVDGAEDWTRVTPQLDGAAGEVLRVAMLASGARSSDPIDRAIFEISAAPNQPHSHAPLKTYPLKPERLAIIQVWRLTDGDLAAAKGAPETIFDMCRLDAEHVARLRQSIDQMATNGLRVLGVASTPISEPGDAESARFSFLGLIGFLDPLREDAAQAVREARQAGIEVAMITGDHPSTALEIARQAGIETSAGVLTGLQLDALGDDELRRVVQKIRIFARISPQQKLRLVRNFQAAGQVVAMTGDGVNDGPALQAADIGIAMGKRGSDIAREASDIILLDDSLASIVGGIRLGRRIFANLRRALTYIVAVHIPLAGLAFVPLLGGWPPLLLPMHLVLLELAIDPVCSLVFESEPSEAGAMQRPPRRRGEVLFGRRQLGWAILQGLGILITIAAFYAWALTVAGAREARGAAFASLVIANLTLAISNASGGSAGLFDRRHAIFWTISGIATAVVGAAFVIEPLGDVLQLAVPPAGLLGIGASLAVLAGCWYGVGSILVARVWPLPRV